MTDSSTIYVGDPDIPPGMTIAEYRHSRPAAAPWWRRVSGLGLERGLRSRRRNIPLAQ